MDKKYRLEIPEKLDLGMASCVSYQNDAKLANKLNLQLIIKSIYLIISDYYHGDPGFKMLLMTNTQRTIFKMIKGIPDHIELLHNYKTYYV